MVKIFIVLILLRVGSSEAFWQKRDWNFRCYWSRENSWWAKQPPVMLVVTVIWWRISRFLHSHIRRQLKKKKSTWLH